MAIARVLALAALLSGCAHYWVAQPALDAYTALPRKQRRNVELDATRVRDGQAVRIRGDAIHLLPISDGPRRQVRLLRAQTIVGLILVGAGVASIAVGGALYAQPPSCTLTCSFTFDAHTGGLLLLLSGIPQLAVGIPVLVGGALSGEVRAPPAPLGR